MRSTIHMLILSIFSVAGCALQGNGVIETEAREVEPFVSVSLRSDLNVDIIAAEDIEDIQSHRELADNYTPTVQVICDQNLLDVIKTRVQNLTLIVEVEDQLRLNPTGQCMVEIGQTAIRELSNTDAGMLFAENLNGYGVMLKNTGEGTIEVEGDSIYGITAEVSGEGSVRARNLPAFTGDAINTGEGTLSVHISDILYTKNTGEGVIHVYGSPAGVDRDNRGSGQIVVH